MPSISRHPISRHRKDADSVGCSGKAITGEHQIRNCRHRLCGMHVNAERPNETRLLQSPAVPLTSKRCEKCDKSTASHVHSTLKRCTHHNCSGLTKKSMPHGAAQVRATAERPPLPAAWYIHIALEQNKSKMSRPNSFLANPRPPFGEARRSTNEEIKKRLDENRPSRRPV